MGHSFFVFLLQGVARGGPVTWDGFYMTKFDLMPALDEVLSPRSFTLRYNSPYPTKKTEISSVWDIPFLFFFSRVTPEGGQ